ncbi:hypothetical protein VNO77_31480 [Canavalia gladiata]|uniref:Uncharacterized protein n=1 Tax=Canavalia gladiata TaxID=3824 RepID=A0AAN9KRQ0_CANGL
MHKSPVMFYSNYPKQSSWLRSLGMPQKPYLAGSQAQWTMNAQVIDFLYHGPLVTRQKGLPSHSMDTYEREGTNNMHAKQWRDDHCGSVNLYQEWCTQASKCDLPLSHSKVQLSIERVQAGLLKQ